LETKNLTTPTEFKLNSVILSYKYGLGTIKSITETSLTGLFLEDGQEHSLELNDKTIKLIKDYDPELASQVEFFSTPKIRERLAKLSNIKIKKESTKKESKIMSMDFDKLGANIIESYKKQLELRSKNNNLDEITEES